MTEGGKSSSRVEESLCISKPVPGVGDAGKGKIHQPLGRHRPQPRLGQGPAHLALVKIAVGHGGDAAPDHLGTGQERPPEGLVRIEPGALRREDFLGEPFLQGKIVGQPPKPHHGGVAVGIDQPRHHQGALHIQVFPGRGQFLGPAGLAYGFDGAALHRHESRE